MANHRETPTLLNNLVPANSFRQSHFYGSEGPNLSLRNDIRKASACYFSWGGEHKELSADTCDTSMVSVVWRWDWNVYSNIKLIGKEQNQTRPTMTKHKRLQCQRKKCETIALWTSFSTVWLPQKPRRDSLRIERSCSLFSSVPQTSAHI